MSTQNTTDRRPGEAGQPAEPLRFLIVGAGAAGGFVAARLAGAGHHVTVLALPRSAERLRANGLRVAGQDGTSVLRPAVVTADQLTPGYDAIVLAVKSDGLAGAMADIEPPSTRVDRLASAFKDAGADVTVPGNILDAMWAKWVFMASLGAVTSLMRAAVDDIVAVPGGQRFAQSVLSEAAAAAAAYGHPVPAGQLRATEQALTTPGSPATSSLTRDLIAGRRTEVEAVLADLAARARAAGTGTALIDLAVLALRVHNRQVAS